MWLNEYTVLSQHYGDTNIPCCTVYDEYAKEDLNIHLQARFQIKERGANQ